MTVLGFIRFLLKLAIIGAAIGTAVLFAHEYARQHGQRLPWEPRSQSARLSNTEAKALARGDLVSRYQASTRTETRDTKDWEPYSELVKCTEFYRDTHPYRCHEPTPGAPYGQRIEHKQREVHGTHTEEVPVAPACSGHLDLQGEWTARYDSRRGVWSVSFVSSQRRRSWTVNDVTKAVMPHQC